MYGVDFYGRVRLAVLGQGISQREAARRYLARDASLQRPQPFVQTLVRTWKFRVNTNAGLLSQGYNSF